PARALPSECQLPAGRVSLRITRRVADDEFRSDLVRMTLRPGSRHLVVVGDSPIQGEVVRKGNSYPFASAFPAPGVVCLDESKRQLVVQEHESPHDTARATGPEATISDHLAGPPLVPLAAREPIELRENG